MNPSGRPRRLCYPLYAGIILLSGCTKTPPALAPPDIDPQSSSAKAIELYDADRDGQLAANELSACAPLAATIEDIDTNSDRKLSADEIAQFMQRRFIDAGAGAIRLKCIVTLDNRPLVGANVTFEPADFIAQGILHTAYGETDESGSANISVPPDQLEDTRAGILPGLYIIRVSKQKNGQEQIPAKYNTNTLLGGEVARRASYMPGALELRLQSR